MRSRKYQGDIPEPIPGNYYPMVATSYIRDGANQLTLLSHRSHGFSSQSEGQVELMLHRRVLQSDTLGKRDCTGDSNRSHTLRFYGKLH
jgi:hypothetical protein